MLNTFLPKIPGGDNNKKAIIVLLFILALVAFPLILLGGSMIGDRLGEGISSQFEGMGIAGGVTGELTADAINCVVKGSFGMVSSAQVASIETKRPVYEAAANNSKVSWDIIAAIHMRETGLRTDISDPFQSGNSGGFTVSSATLAANKLVSLGKWVYGIDIRKNSSDTNIKWSYLAYNRGRMYKMAGLSYEVSPYVINFIDESHKNMVWPNNAIAEPASIRGTVNRQIGAFSFLNLLRKCAGTAGSGSSPASIQGTALPIKQSDMTNKFNNTLHNCSVSFPYNCDKPRHRAALGSLGPGGTNIPHIPSSGEAADIMTKHNAVAYAPFSGKITKKGAVSASNPSMGNQLMLQSNDGRMAAAMLHLNKSGLVAKSTVKVGEPVGTIIPMKDRRGNDITHLHFELWIDKKVVNAGGPGSGATGKKIWERQKKALGF